MVTQGHHTIYNCDNQHFRMNKNKPAIIKYVRHHNLIAIFSPCIFIVIQ